LRLIVLVAVIASALTFKIYQLDDFEDFVVAYNKTYTSAEKAYRRQVFNDNLVAIQQHNAKGHSYTLTMNEFGDLTAAEFKSTYLGLRSRIVNTLPRKVVNLKGLFTVPASVDWRQKNAVTGVKNQGQCGSCWAFSTTGSVEGAHAIKSGKLVSVSEQQLVDCSSSFGNEGCSGGLMDDAFKYIISNKGICSEASYTYKGVDGTCQKCTPVTTISSYADVTPNDEAALEAAASLQPVSVAVEADQLGWQFYSGGVMSSTCGTNLDHGVLVAGYGTDSSSGQAYWLVKNSWGATWGEQGYIRLLKGLGGAGQCGIAMDPSYPIV